MTVDDCPNCNDDSWDEDDFDEDDGYGFCDICGDDLSDGSSHYHCANCLELCSMMGHSDMETGDFTCEHVCEY